jgi:hypothetical protein
MAWETDAFLIAEIGLPTLGYCVPHIRPIGEKSHEVFG